MKHQSPYETSLLMAYYKAKQSNFPHFAEALLALYCAELERGLKRI